MSSHEGRSPRKTMAITTQTRRGTKPRERPLDTAPLPRGALHPQRLGPAILPGVVPAPPLSPRRELGDDETLGRPAPLERVRGPPGGEKLTAVLLHRRRDLL